MIVRQRGQRILKCARSGVQNVEFQVMSVKYHLY